MNYECKTCHWKFKTAELFHEHQIMYAHHEPTMSIASVDEADDPVADSLLSDIISSEAAVDDFSPQPETVDYSPDPFGGVDGGTTDFGGGGSGGDW